MNVKCLFRYLWVTVIVAVFFACEQPQSLIKNVESKTAVTIPLSGDKIVLGNKLPNPFAIDESRAVSSEQANYYYLKVRSDDAECILTLLNNYPNAQRFPLDYEIIEGGYYFDEPDLDESVEFPWFYLVVSDNEYEQLKQDEYTIDIIESMYIPSETVAAMKEPANNARAIGSPYGYITLKNTITGNYEPLPNAKVVVSHYFTNASAYTNNQGYFHVNATYNDWWWPLPLIKVVFDNSQCSIHDLFNFFFPVEYVIGGRLLSQMQGATFSIDISPTVPNTIGSAATIMKAVYEYNEYAALNGITAPGKLRILMYGVTNQDPGACWMAQSVMGPHIATIYSAVGALIGTGAGGPLGAVVGLAGGFVAGSLIGASLPDILIPFYPWPTMDNVTEHYTSIVYHELAHASHMRVIGSTSWFQEYVDKIMSLTNITSYTEADRLIEAWAYFVGYNAMTWRYNSNSTNLKVAKIGNAYLQFNEGNMVYPGTGFYNGAFHDLNKRYTISKLFNVLKDSRVSSAQAYFDRFVSLYSLSPTEASVVQGIFVSNQKPVILRSQ